MRQIKNRFRKEQKLGKTPAQDVQNAEDEEESDEEIEPPEQPKIVTPIKVGPRRSATKRDTSYAPNATESKANKSEVATTTDIKNKKRSLANQQKWNSNQKYKDEQISGKDSEKSPIVAKNTKERKEFSGQKDTTTAETGKRQYLSKRQQKLQAKEEAKALERDKLEQ